MPKDPRHPQQVQGTSAARKANYTGARPNDDSKLLDTPGQALNRLRRAVKRDSKGGLRHLDGRIQRDIATLYRKPLEDWDAQELAFGRPRDENGQFTGRMPTWITPIVQAEAKRRLLNNTFGKMAEHIELAVQVVYDLMTSQEIDEKGRPLVDARTKLAAAQFVLEHFIGKPKIFVEAEVNDFTKSAIAAAIVLDDGGSQDHFVVEGQVVEEDNDA